MSMKGKVLHIYSDFGLKNGGALVTKRNANALISIFSPENYQNYAIQNKHGFEKLFVLANFCRGLFSGLTGLDIERIIKIIIENEIKYVFIDSSNYGVLVKKIKELDPEINVITFFHNCEKYFIRQIYKSVKRNLYVNLSSYNEKTACRLSNKIICLNHRDCEDIIKEYGRIPDVRIPVSIDDTYVYDESLIHENDMIILFVGSYFKPNIDGIMWFINNVLPSIEGQLWIVGNNMDQLKIRNSDRISVFSNVNSMSEFYEKAKCIVIPIFSGSGMKVKTAEALMYGKIILSSNEGLEGYDVEDGDIFRCNTKEEFIEAINCLKNMPSYSKKNKEIFVNNYSNNAVKELFRAIFREK